MNLLKINIDRTKVDKRLIKLGDPDPVTGVQPQFLNMIVFPTKDGAPNRFGQSGTVVQDASKELRESGYEPPILGHVEIIRDNPALQTVLPNNISLSIRLNEVVNRLVVVGKEREDGTHAQWINAVLIPSREKKFGNDGRVEQQLPREARERNERPVILGNFRVLKPKEERTNGSEQSQQKTKTQARDAKEVVAERSKGAQREGKGKARTASRARESQEQAHENIPY